MTGGRYEALEGKPLSRRETEVMDWLADGLTTREIAAKLFVSEHTVRSHKESIYRKLGVRSAVEAVAHWHKSAW